jgi:hypothetical protein
VDPPWQPRWFTRQAGTGSLGHPRLVAVAPAEPSGWAARESKLLGPSSAEWPAGPPHRPQYEAGLFERVLHTVRGPAPCLRVDGWLIRRLAPDAVRIDIARLAPHAIERVVVAMAQAVVDVHGVDPDALAAARTDSATLGRHWLRDATAAMVADTRAGYAEWCAARA